MLIVLMVRMLFLSIGGKKFFAKSGSRKERGAVVAMAL
jgi:hypothetical protein